MEFFHTFIPNKHNKLYDAWVFGGRANKRLCALSNIFNNDPLSIAFFN